MQGSHTTGKSGKPMKIGKTFPGWEKPDENGKMNQNREKNGNFVLGKSGILFWEKVAYFVIGGRPSR